MACIFTFIQLIIWNVVGIIAFRKRMADTLRRLQRWHGSETIVACQRCERPRRARNFCLKRTTTASPTILFLKRMTKESNYTLKCCKRLRMPSVHQLPEVKYVLKALLFFCSTTCAARAPPLVCDKNVLIIDVEFLTRVMSSCSKMEIFAKLLLKLHEKCLITSHNTKSTWLYASVDA